MFTVGYGLNKPWYLHRVGSHAAVTIIIINPETLYVLIWKNPRIYC